MVGRGGVALVSHDREPGVVGAELDRVLLGVGVVGEPRDGASLDVDTVQVVLLVALHVPGEDDEAVVAVPGEAGTDGARHLAVAHLARGARGEVHDVQLQAAGLVPVEGQLVAGPGHGRQVERRQAAQLHEREAPPTVDVVVMGPSSRMSAVRFPSQCTAGVMVQPGYAIRNGTGARARRRARAARLRESHTSPAFWEPAPLLPQAYSGESCSVAFPHRLW